ncbi:tetratricopeptide repeat protein 4 [Ceratobasidium sp. AG-Ba]|nr:tetratricopeptide repeat protein 4 [Ceratobasidium sp. AG-Ba]QRV99383.1 tetratricopeptide repeat protein 4 [Ceratobasidium sp. AG-Ba]QRW13888.1 tetratricopeptide repeat protein 4 [Ceratobasidium sp. AG-Ba]
MDPKSVKALYRAARALNRLRRPEEVLGCCERALVLEPHNGPLREEKRQAEKGVTESHRINIELMYQYNQFYIIPTSKVIPHHSLPTTHPEDLPYLDPPPPVNGLESTIISRIEFRYTERYPSDLICDFPSEKPILPLIDTLLPDATFTPQSSQTRNNLMFITKEVDSKFTHPTIWDPEFEFTPSKVSVGIQTRQGRIVPVKRKMSLGCA